MVCMVYEKSIEGNLNYRNNSITQALFHSYYSTSNEDYSRFSSPSLSHDEICFPLQEDYLIAW